MKSLFIILLSLINISYASNQPKSISIYQTSRQGDRLKLIDKPFGNIKYTDYNIKIDPNQTHQTIIGIGSSFTESAAAVWFELSKTKQYELINDYFSPNGAWLSLTRTHIGSCDFSVKSYSYAPVPDDNELMHFNIDPDRKYLLPLIKAAQGVRNSAFKIIASPWTSPPWMKTNLDWYGGELCESHYQTFSDYISKYIKMYQKEGIDIWGITPENEPLGNDSNWESLHFNPHQMLDFIKHYLGPTLSIDHPSVSIWMYDQNREEEMIEWTNTIYSDELASSYVMGTAVHWYQSTVDIGGDILDQHHNLYPDKQILHTEGCIDSIGNDEQIGSWLEDDWYWRAEATDWGYFWAKPENKKNHPKYRPFYRYTRDLIQGFNNHLVGWIDWNMMLNERGGPNHAGNFCLAPILVNSGLDSYHLTPLYYSIAHVSKFVRPGAKRISLSGCDAQLMGVSFENLDESKVLILFNTSTKNIAVTVELDEFKSCHEIPSEALQTIIIK